MNARSKERVKLRSSLLTALMRVPSTASNSRPLEVEPPVQQHELAEHRFEGAAVVASEVRDRLEVGLQAAHQPDDLDIALGFPLQPSARSDPVEVAIDVELQQIARRIARPPRSLRFDPREAGARKIEPINEGLDEPNRIVDCLPGLARLGRSAS